MATIIFDEESRVFSVIETELYSEGSKEKKFNWGSKGTLMTAGGAVVGGTASALAANKKAKKAAIERGLEPGTPEYKSFVRKRTALAGTIGTVGGAALGGGAAFGLEMHGQRKAWKKLKPEQGAPDAVIKMHEDAKPGSKAAWKAMWLKKEKENK